MFNFKVDNTLTDIYKNIQKLTEDQQLSEPNVEDILNDVKNDPKKYIKSILDSENLVEILTKYIENVDKEDADLGILASTLSQIINKVKDTE